ncbi:MAG: DUF58 domain-containing protein [Crocinitomicaceae bacterium]|nr:DUF58 domain-containing protein [Crocinitomicaceae bacterium]
MKNIYLSKFFFLLFTIGVVLYAIGSFVELLIFPAQLFFISLGLLTLLDALLIFLVKKPLSYQRTLKERIDLGDANKIKLTIVNQTRQPLLVRFYEGFPVEMQERNRSYHSLLLPHKDWSIVYEFIPTKRGDVVFNSPYFILSSVFHLVQRRILIDDVQSVKIFPSMNQLKKYELMVFSNKKIQTGIKRIRKIGNNSEFEQIKEYIQGDEVKSINWKATSRTNSLKVNKYQEEKSQNVYCVLDKSRSMQMEFDDLSLLDYSINSILTLSNIMLKNGDKIGLFTFSDTIDSKIIAGKNNYQMQLLIDALYNQETAFKNPNYELLYQTIRTTVKTRSLFILFTNFETEEALHRALPILQKINQKHLLVVVLFQNSDLEVLSFRKPKAMREVYQSIVAEQMTELKTKIVAQLRQSGIQTILTLPNDLTVKSINKYLELKAKGML